METRPLALNNCDNKQVCAAAARAASPTIQTHAHESQNGFIQGRQLLQNPVDLDFSSRVSAIRCAASRGNASFDCMLPNHSVSKLAVTLLFDFSTAFPSVFHEWIFAVLDFIKAPRDFCNVVRNRYKDSNAYWMQNGSYNHLFPVGGGVQQGCPLSSVLFVLAIDPLLWVLSQVVAKPALGCVRVCADDIGISLRHLSTVKALYDIFPGLPELVG